MGSGATCAAPVSDIPAPAHLQLCVQLSMLRSLPVLMNPLLSGFHIQTRLQSTFTQLCFSSSYHSTLVEWTLLHMKRGWGPVPLPSSSSTLQLWWCDASRNWPIFILFFGKNLVLFLQTHFFTRHFNLAAIEASHHSLIMLNNKPSAVSRMIITSVWPLATAYNHSSHRKLGGNQRRKGARGKKPHRRGERGKSPCRPQLIKGLD